MDVGTDFLFTAIDNPVCATSLNSFFKLQEGYLQLNSDENARKKRIFVIDDNEDVLTVLKLSLEMLGYEVSEFALGKDALKQYQHEKPDVVIVDQGLPDIMGLEVGQQIREMESGHACSLILLTGNDGQPLRDQAEDIGFNDFLVKPVRMNELAECVAQ